MYKIRDFIDKEVFLVSGKKLGYVKGLLVDFDDKKMSALIINRFGLFKNKYVSYKDIISIGNVIIVNKINEPFGIKISNILMKNVYGKEGILKGNVSDVLINVQSLDLVALICYRGIGNKIKNGDIVIPINQVILGDEYILDTGNENITFNSVIHKAKEEMLNDNSK